MQRFPPRHEVDHPAQRSFSGTAGWGTHAAALEGQQQGADREDQQAGEQPGRIHGGVAVVVER